MIRGFKCRHTQELWESRESSNFGSDIVKRGYARMAQLNAAKVVADMRLPKSNQLEALKGNRIGQFSVRVNKQWRLCFTWGKADDGPHGVEIVDYH